MTKGDLGLFPGEKPRVFVAFGKIEVGRLDERNWTVTGDGRVTYHTTIAYAIQEAAHRTTNAKSRSAETWLLNYRSLVADFERLIEKFEQVVENKGSKKLVEILCPKSKRGRKLDTKNRPEIQPENASGDPL